MFAVFKTGGKQYRVAADDKITVMTVAGNRGDIVTFGEVLMLVGGDKSTVGAPTIAGASARTVDTRKRLKTLRVTDPPPARSIVMV